MNLARFVYEAPEVQWMGHVDDDGGTPTLAVIALRDECFSAQYIVLAIP